MLGVHRDLIENHGAVSSRVARAMADGALTHSGADVSVAVTGVAGPEVAPSQSLWALCISPLHG